MIQGHTVRGNTISILLEPFLEPVPYVLPPQNSQVVPYIGMYGSGIICTFCITPDLHIDN